MSLKVWKYPGEKEVTSTICQAQRAGTLDPHSSSETKNDDYLSCPCPCCCLCGGCYGNHRFGGFREGRSTDEKRKTSQPSPFKQTGEGEGTRAAVSSESMCGFARDTLQQVITAVCVLVYVHVCVFICAFVLYIFEYVYDYVHI